MKSCFYCGKQATLQRIVLSNDPYEQHCCSEHKSKENSDNILWQSTEWESINNSNNNHTHIHRG